MEKKILVIGGTMFLGKAFVNMALEEGHEVTVLHRGSNVLGIRGVRELFADRHDIGRLGELFSESEKFDAIVDFCGYSAGDAEGLLKSIKARIDQYIFISTSDVYRRGENKLLSEDAPFEDRDFGKAAGAYILGKVALEQEIPPLCSEMGCDYTILRPVFIFGEDNYAPREGIYFNWILNAGQILHPLDSTGKFQMVYVKDVAKAILLALGNPKAYNRAFNVCGEETFDYNSYADLLAKAIDIPFSKAELPVATINEMEIPLPFPLTKQESNYYDGSSIKGLGLTYTDSVVAMRDTFLYSAFRS